MRVIDQNLPWSALFFQILNILLPIGVIVFVIIGFRVILKRFQDSKHDSGSICDRKVLGERIRVRRNELKMSQEFVADSIGVSRQAVSKWERGIAEPNCENLRAIAELFHVTVEELIKN